MKKYLAFVVFVSVASLLILGAIFIYGCGAGGGPSESADVFFLSSGGKARATGSNGGTIRVITKSLYTNAPMQGLTVEVYGPATSISSEVTDALGECAFTNLPAGKLLVTVHKESDMDVSVLCNARKVEFFLGESSPSYPTGTITGEVKNAGGLPVSGLYVRCFAKSGDYPIQVISDDSTNSSGKFIIENAPAGTVVLSVLSSEGSCFVIDSLDAGASKEVNLNIPASQANIQGTATTGGLTLSAVSIQLVYLPFDANFYVGTAALAGNSYSANLQPTTNDVKYLLAANTENIPGLPQSLALEPDPISVSSGSTKIINFTLKDTPEIIAPAKGATGTSKTPAFSWEAASWMPDHYLLQYFIPSGSFFTHYIGLKETSFQVRSGLDLEGNEDYKWWASAVELNGGDPSSNTISNALFALFIASDTATFETAP